ncbi:unnamed protein product [Oppiella nova]|uniref:Uncharacterized protein n=1 Tax=Oppiella nova TaxID=334625 RepID=A0A7R9LAN3_9ACAR|nr:unnamed protein product [Oppiella nova]CAG2161639.1 unnamed protein product [Oppiella nova]
MFAVHVLVHSQQLPTNDVMSILKPWSFGQIGTTGQAAGNQFLQLLQSSLTRWDELGQQIGGQVSSRLESMENQLHDLAKQFRLTLLNTNNKNNTTRATKV